MAISNPTLDSQGPMIGWLYWIMSDIWIYNDLYSKIGYLYYVLKISKVSVIPLMRPWTRLLLRAASFPPNTVVQRWESWILLSSKPRKKKNTPSVFQRQNRKISKGYPKAKTKPNSHANTPLKCLVLKSLNKRCPVPLHGSANPEPLKLGRWQSLEQKSSPSYRVHGQKKIRR